LIIEPEIREAIDYMLENLDCEEFWDERDRLIYWRVKHPPNPRGYFDVKLEYIEGVIFEQEDIFVKGLDGFKNWVKNVIGIQEAHDARNRR